jgi:uncharacterized protein YjbI with pentapeptide repeats
MAPWL